MRVFICLLLMLTLPGAVMASEESTSATPRNTQGSGPVEVPMYDGLGRPMNEAAKRDEANPSGKTAMNLFLDSPEQAKLFQDAVNADREGKKPKNLSYAVLLHKTLAELAALIDGGMDPNVVDEEFGTPLIVAIEQHRGKECVALLLKKGAKPNLVGRGVLRPLGYAIYKKDMETITLLLAAKADPNNSGSDTPPLMYVAERGYLPIAQALLKAGANPNIRNEDGYTPFWALIGNSMQPSMDMVNLLLSYKADPKAVTKKGRNALALLDWKDKNHDLILLLLKKGLSGKTMDSYGKTIAVYAARDNKATFLKEAIKAGADIHIADKRGYTPLQYAEGNGNKECVAILKAAGAKK